MADGYFPTLVSKDNNANSQTNPLFTGITDGTDLVLVDSSGNLQVLVNNGAGASAVNIQDGGNTITVDGSVSISGSVTVTASDLDIRDLTLAQDAVKVSANSTANSSGNPIFVSFTEATITGEVHNYDTASGVGAAATSNHDYTVVTAMLVKSIIFSSSGPGKVEVKTGPIASLVTKAVAFIPALGQSVQLNFNPPIEVPTTGTGTVRLIRTNRAALAQDLYSTIIGIDA